MFYVFKVNAILIQFSFKKFCFSSGFHFSQLLEEIFEFVLYSIVPFRKSVLCIECLVLTASKVSFVSHSNFKTTFQSKSISKAYG